MLRSRYFVVLPAALLLIGLLGFYAVSGNLFTASVYYGALGLPVFVACLPSRLVYERYKRAGTVHYWLGCTSLGVLALAGWSTWAFEYADVALPDAIRTVHAGAFFITGGLTLVGFLCAVPTLVIPHLLHRFRRRAARTADVEDESYDLGFVDRGLQNIRSTFGQIQSSIANERTGIERALDQFRQNLESQDKELKKAQESLQKTRVEARHYKELAALSEEQQNALLHALGKHRYVDYVVGFVLGIIGSGLVALATNFLPPGGG